MNHHIGETLARQRAFFATGATRAISYRIRALKRLRQIMQEREEEIFKALRADLHKSEYESYMTEIGPVLEEIRHTVAALKRWSRPERHLSPFSQFPAVSVRYPEPYGVVLIVSPWNYPFNLAMMPLVGAVAAGNCVVLKTGHAASRTSNILAKLLEEAFGPQHVAVFEGGREVNQEILEQRFDYIFFTGGTTVGRIVMQAAAKHLTPLTLELGGKSPCVVLKDAPVGVTAKRICWGKFLNSGQTCVAPDYLLVHSDKKEDLVACIIREIENLYGQKPAESPDFCRIISERHFDRIKDLMKAGSIIYGGDSHRETRYIGPTLIEGIDLEDPIMREEIFGPVLPIIEFDDPEEALTVIRNKPTPLALYVFGRNRRHISRFLSEVPFGGGCVNDTVTHLVDSHLPFGGKGSSGMGAYHGKASFDTFTHYKSVMRKSLLIDMPVRYAPYTRFYFKLLRMIMR